MSLTYFISTSSSYKNNWSYIVLVLCGQSMQWIQLWVIENTLYDHEIEDCATMHIEVKWCLHGKTIYWHFSALKCLDLQLMYFYFYVPFLQATVNFAVSCYNSSCPIMDCQQGLKHQHGGEEWSSRQCLSNPSNNWRCFLFWYIPFSILPITYLDGHVKIKDITIYFVLIMNE